MHRRSTGALSAALLVSVLMSGCAQPGSGPAAPRSSLPSAQTSTTVSGGASHSPSPAATAAGAEVTATDHDNGRTVTLARGQRLKVVLSSTYWTFQDSSDAAILRAETTPHANPQPSGCVPGAGCGTVTVTYLAAASGQTTVVATRTSCGEAMGCASGADRYSLRVIVS